MKQNDRQDPVARDNRQNWPKFVAVLIVSLFVGGVIGYAMAWVAGDLSLDGVADGIGAALGACAPWIVLCSLLFWAGGVVCYRRAKGIFSAWDGESEDVPEAAEHLLSWAILWLTVTQFFSFVAFSVATSLVPLGHVAYPGLLMATVEFLAVILLVLFTQQRVIDLTRRINPEKQGSVYDFKFRKKWLSSCDEAERQRIGQAAYSSFLVTARVAMLVWMVMVFANLILPIGPLPVLAALIPWAAGQISYLGACLKMERSRPSSANE